MTGHTDTFVTAFRQSATPLAVFSAQNGLSFNDSCDQLFRAAGYDPTLLLTGFFALKPQPGDLTAIPGPEGEQIPLRALLQQFDGFRLLSFREDQNTTSPADRRLQQLYTMTRRIAESPDPEKIVPQIAANAQQLVHADTCTIFLLNREEEKLYPFYTNDQEFRDNVMAFTLDLGQGITGQVALTGQAEIIADTSRDDRVYHLPGTPPDQNTLISVPIIHKNRVIGVVTLDRHSEHPFTHNDLETLTIFASQVSGIVVNAGMYRKLERSRELYRSLFNTSILGIFRMDPEGGFIQANQSYLDLLQLPDLNALQQADPVLPWGTVEDRQDFFRLLLEDFELSDFNCRVTRGDGSVIHLRYNARLNRSHDMIEGVAQDITREVMLENESLYRLLFLERLTEQLPMPLLIFDPQGKLQQINPAVEQVLQLASKTQMEHYQERIMEMLPQLAGYGEQLARGEVVRNRGLHVTLSDEHDLVLNMTGFPILDHQGDLTHMVYVLEDISETTSLREQLYQSQKMDNLGNLAGGIAHDFNNILGAIMGYSSLMNRYLSNPEKLELFSERIENSARKASLMTRNLLGYIRKSTDSEIQSVDVQSAVRTSINLFQHSVDKDIRIDLPPDPPPLKVNANQGQLEQILLNLLINASDALTDRPQPLIELRWQLVTVPTASGSNPMIEITCRDNGSGIPAAVRDRIFEPFFTTKARGKGTGLGLSTVKSIVALFQGHIELESEPGQGTVFHIFLPAGQVKPPASQATPHTELKQGKGTIWIIDDDPIIRDVTQTMLKRIGYQVTVWKYAGDALNRLQQDDTKVDLILLDIVMPRMSGSDFLAALDSAVNVPPIIICSGYTGEISSRRLEENPRVTGFLNKPYTIENLSQIVHDTLNRNAS